MARSGGAISIVMMLFCAYLAKLSFDLLISLTIETGAVHASYEELGSLAYGHQGKLAVLLSKGIFAFGGLVAIVIIVKDNFAPSLQHLTGLSPSKGGWTALLLDDNSSTLFLSALVMLPLSLLRDMTPLERFSAVKIVTFVLILLVVVYLYWSTPTPNDIDGTFCNHWLQVRVGAVSSFGTFVFTFIAQHTCHMVYRSLERPSLSAWQSVTTNALTMSVLLALPIGLFPYLTFWQETSSNLFLMYPPSPAVDLARILLCLTMLLTYPPPFFCCRELIVVALGGYRRKHVPMETADELLATEEAALINKEFQHALGEYHWCLPGDPRQLIRPYHVLLTLVLWAVTLVLALAAPNLGDVLDLVGCTTGTIIAFILPAVFSFQVRGYSHTAALLLAVGVVVGCLGTYTSLVELIHDL